MRFAVRALTVAFWVSVAFLVGWVSLNALDVDRGNARLDDLIFSAFSIG